MSDIYVTNTSNFPECIALDMALILTNGVNLYNVSEKSYCCIKFPKKFFIWLRPIGSFVDVEKRK